MPADTAASTISPSDKYARYQGRVVEILAVFGASTPKDEGVSYYQIRDGSSIEQVFPHQLTPHSAPVVQEVTAVIYINEVVDPKVLVELPTIGTTSAKKIIERKPDGGYKNMDELIFINHDLNRTDWDALKTLIKF
jgi:DNA uptake protein ComE-like DNA-binding protein